jgi:ketosteroid isomerase-like protein
VGPDGVVAGFSEPSEISRAVERYFDAGESVVALGFYDGTHRSTGRSVRAEFAHLFELEDGRIDCFVQYTDTLKVSEAVDLIEVGWAWCR